MNLAIKLLLPPHLEELPSSVNTFSLLGKLTDMKKTDNRSLIQHKRLVVKFSRSSVEIDMLDACEKHRNIRRTRLPQLYICGEGEGG